MTPTTKQNTRRTTQPLGPGPVREREKPGTVKGKKRAVGAREAAMRALREEQATVPQK